MDHHARADYHHHYNKEEEIQCQQISPEREKER